MFQFFNQILNFITTIINYFVTFLKTAGLLISSATSLVGEFSVVLEYIPEPLLLASLVIIFVSLFYLILGR